jgi:D-alanine-D-alanine ligase
MKIAIVYDVWEGTEEYPGAAADAEAKAEEQEESSAKKKKRPKKKIKKEHRPKLDREEIFQALKKLDHEPVYLEIDGHDQTLTALARSRADLFFNLTESYAGDDTKDKNLAAYFDLLDMPYTGSGPEGLFLAQDKALAKKIFNFHGISTPQFAISYKGKTDHAHDLEFPLIVKPSSEDGSIGIDVGSVVDSVKELMERMHYIHEEFDSPALLEQYIEGREIYAAVIGNNDPEALPLVELDLSKLPEGVPKIAGYEVKFERDTEAYKRTKSAIAEDIDEETTQRLQETAVDAYKALKLRDYARIDMRLTSDGRIYVIEANPNPWLSSGAEFAMAARKSGRSYTEMVKAIVDFATARYAD